MIEENRWTNDGINFNKEIDGLESKMTFSLIKSSLFEGIIACGRNLEARLFDKKENFNQNFSYDLTILILKVISLQYRIKASRGGLSPSKHPTDILALKAAFLLWKSKALFPDKNLTKSDLAKIEELARYEKFVRVLLQNKRAMDE